MNPPARPFTLALLLPAALLAGCQPQAAEAPPASVPASAPVVVQLPDCNSADAVDVGPTGMSGCRLSANGETGWGGDLTYTGEPGELRRLSLRLTADDGSEIQTISEEIESTFSLPSFDDLDGDGRAELLVPLMTGNVNTTFAVWRRKEGEATFVRTGEVSGIDVTPYEDGMFVTPARGSASTWHTTYYLFVDGMLQPVASAENTLSDDGAETCTLVDEGGLAAAGMTAEAARVRFCAAE